ncbi:MAG: MBL fold metallo-hydrolase [Gammaproteobacteria bacterium]|nr:MBL fold metallo-hydrolase [Gammaproteobacteria bacterium]
MKLSFHGADRAVTGSCHLVEAAGQRVLIDCGMYQGNRELDEENAEAFGFDPASIDYVLLTHAHLDHCGRLPLLVKRGFHGEIVTTAATRELTRIVLLDAAHLQEEDAARRARRHARRGETPAPEPLYGVLDALNSTERFGRTASYGRKLALAPGIDVTFFDAGHILGSASLFLEVAEHGERRRIVFSGDLGNAGRPLLRDPVAPPRSDVVVMETTYGDRLHKPIGPSVEELYGAIDATFRRGGNVIIPTFALERAQEILYYLREGVERGRLGSSMQVFLDSPMAISATEIFRRHPECFDAEAAARFRAGQDPFGLPGLHFSRETAESMQLNRVVGGAVILAGSGMATGGRVRHHLRHNLWREQCGVVFVGFAAKGTLARRIIDGAKSVSLFGEDVPVRASIHTINGFSAHADRDELLAWHRQIQPEVTFLVHGEEDVMSRFATNLTHGRIVQPSLGQSDEL